MRDCGGTRSRGGNQIKTEREIGNGARDLERIMREEKWLAMESYGCSKGGKKVLIDYARSTPRGTFDDMIG